MQVLVYVLALAVTALILYQGYKAIATIRPQMCKTEIIRFQNQLNSELKAAAGNFGSVYNLDLPMPCSYNAIIFVDIKGSPGSSTLNPLIVEAWDAKSQNVFLVPMASQKIVIGENFSVGHASGTNVVEDKPDSAKKFVSDLGFVRIDSTAGFAKIRIEGIAGHAMISAQ